MKKLEELTEARLVPCGDRETWLTERRHSIGGSESPTLFGCGYGSLVSVWGEKVEPDQPSESTERQQIGLGLEPFVCNLYQQKFGGEVERWPEWMMARHREHPYIHATPDAVLFEEGRTGPGALSIKTWSEFRQSDWESEPPLYAQVQVQQELAVLGWDWAAIAVLFGAQKLERFYVERNDQFIAELLKACSEFWRYVVDRVVPPIDESEATAETLLRLHPDDNGKAVSLPVESDAIFDQLVEAKEHAKLAERQEKAAKNQLTAWLGDATFGETPAGRVISWKTQGRSEKCCPDCGSVVTKGSKFRVLRTPKSLPKGVIAERPAPVLSLQSTPQT